MRFHFGLIISDHPDSEASPLSAIFNSRREGSGLGSWDRGSRRTGAADAVALPWEPG
jgi:hypothetical protein